MPPRLVVSKRDKIIRKLLSETANQELDEIIRLNQEGLSKTPEAGFDYIYDCTSIIEYALYQQRLKEEAYYGVKLNISQK